MVRVIHNKLMNRCTATALEFRNHIHCIVYTPVHTHIHSHTHTYKLQSCQGNANETEEKTFLKRKVFTADLKELTDV